MKIVFLTSDWALTGPADPMLHAALGLRARGHEVELVLPPSADGSEPGVEGAARQRSLAPVLSIERGRGVRPWRDRRDATRLRELLVASDTRVVHAWHSRGHALAWMASRSRRREQRSVLVRSHRSGEQIPARPWNRWLFGPACDGLWCVSKAVAHENRNLRSGRPIGGALGGIDLERFRAAPAGGAEEGRRRLRAEFGVAPDAILIGVVARVQPHRRFDLLLGAFQALAERRKDVHLVVLGRGTRLDAVAREPARSLGLEQRVHFAGHRVDGDYVDALRALDWLTFLVPGSDGGCRAVLEAAACGVPCVATRRGALPEIVLDERTGLLIHEDESSLLEAWQRLLDDTELRERLARSASVRAHAEFGAEHLAVELERFYEQVLAGAGVESGDQNPAGGASRLSRASASDPSESAPSASAN